MQIYLARNNVQAGPYTVDELNAMLLSGEVELNDLMWHEGMEKWQRIGIMTHETFSYPPTNLDHVLKSSVDATSETRTSVDRLYGRQPTTTPSNAKPKDTKKHSTDNLITDKLNFSKTASQALAPKKVGTNELADISQRILAVLIDQVLATLCLIPLFAALDFNSVKISHFFTDYAIMSTYLIDLPRHLLILTMLMMLSLIVIQIIMLLKRGQTIGKLITGVRILDINNNEIPNATNIILLRTILTNFAYGMAAAGIIVIVADTLTMLFDAKNRSLHDRLAKTYVVKANEMQLNYKISKNKTTDKT